MKNKREIFLIFIIALLLLIILCLVFGFNNISKFFSNNYLFLSSLASIATCIGLIYTIYYNIINHSKELENSRISANQLEFEKELYGILCVYDDLVSDLLYNLMFIDSSGINIRVDSLLSMSDISIKYRYILNNVHNKIYFFYRNIEVEHPKLDLLIKDIEALNVTINNELNHYSELCNDGFEINKKYLNKVNNDRNIAKEYVYDEFNKDFTQMIDKKCKISNSIIDIISCKKNLIYLESSECIEERATIFKNNKI